jgi:DNA-binding IclR family transcriptional regulator
VSARDLTRSEREVLAAIRKVTSDGWPASVREIASERGNSMSRTYEALTVLVEAGAVLEHPRRSKGGYMPNPKYVESTA